MLQSWAVGWRSKGGGREGGMGSAAKREEEGMG
jgi:hypothetical protein